MQNIVIDQPYEFVPPHRGTGWYRVLQQVYLRRYLRRTYGIERVECRNHELLRGSIEAGHGILLTPNHSRDSDPLVLGELARCVGRPFYFMASWHVFMQGTFMAWLLRRCGAFSIYREGMDRASVNAATEILEHAERPLVIFPEGVASRTNYHLNTLLDGTALIARSAAKKRGKAKPAGKVVVHPVAIHYHFHGDVEKSLGPVLDDIESRLTWRPQRHLSLLERVYKLGEALLSLKEVEYVGKAQSGPIHERLERLIDHLLVPLEAEWAKGEREDHIVARVKRIRTAILPDLIKGEIAEAERERRWRQLADVYLAQQLAHYPPDYVRENATPERLLETVERFEEGITDVARVHRPMSATVEVAPAIEVSPTRESRGSSDPVVTKIEQELKRMLGIAASGEAPNAVAA
jgi:1-acyl-sn-glycerol-3-phosphate acyltransferase